MLRALTSLTLAGLVTVSPATGSHGDVSSIRRYRSQVDAYVRLHKDSFDAVKRERGPLNDGNGPWQRWPVSSKHDQLDSDAGARIWRRNGQVTLVVFTIQSDSGDWALFASHYYRPDGSLAMLESTLNTFVGDVSVERDWYYASDGSALDFKSRCYKLGTRQRLRPCGDFYDVPVPVYRTVSKLPFYRLLRRDAPN